MNFKKNTKPKSWEKNKFFLKNLYNLLGGREKVLDAFESKIFLTKSKGTSFLNLDYSKLKVLTPRQILHRLTIALA